MKWIALFAAIIWGIQLRAQATSNEPDSWEVIENPGNQLLWEITDTATQRKSYLFGSLHSNDRRLFRLADSVYFALDTVETIVLETDIFSIFQAFDTRREAVKIRFDRYGSPYTSSNHATQTSYGDEDGMPQFLDAYFQQYCYNAGKSFEALEELNFQIETFEEVNEFAAEDNVGYESFLTQREDMLELYLSGNIYQLQQFVKASLSLSPEMYETLIIERNEMMSHRLDSLMQNQTLFCAIGAGHLAGSKGVLKLLEKKGYEVRKVVATYTQLPLNSSLQPEATKRVINANSYELVDDYLGLHVIFPGKPLYVQDETMPYLERWLYSDLGQGNTYEVEVYMRDETVDSWSDAAQQFIPAPEEITFESIQLPNGGEAVQGLGQEYWDWSLKWIRILMTEEYVIVLKASGGNKFMNSKRAFRFFDGVWME